MYRFFTKSLQNLDEMMPGGQNKKFMLAFIIFVVWLAFFDKNSWVTQWHLNRTVYKYERQKESLLSNIEKTKEMTIDLNKGLEKFGRETYLMTKSDEDLFIIATE